jgi:type II secretory pathway component PulM
VLAGVWDMKIWRPRDQHREQAFDYAQQKRGADRRIEGRAGPVRWMNGALATQG